jgi:hypothetical protein
MSLVKRIEQPAEEEDLGRDPMQMVKGAGDHKELGLREAWNLRFEFEGVGLPA